MTDLKEILFEAVLDAFLAYDYTRERFGKGNLLTANMQTRFCTLYKLVEDAGLEAEYSAWKGER